MNSLKQKLKKFRWVLTFMLCLSMLSCGGGEMETEEASGSAKAYPSIGVGGSYASKEVPVAEANGFTICIDPGHGFDDVGSSSPYFTDGIEEKHMTLLYATELKEKLESMGYSVLMTHDDQTFPQEFNTNQNNLFSADERAAYVNTLDVDLLISLHCDIFEGDDSVKGSRVYYYDTEIKQNAASDGIAESIGAWLAKEFPEMRNPPIHNNTSYVILRKTTMAAVLVEIGFISNQSDAENIQDPAWMEKFINGVAQGIQNYYIVE